MKTTLLTALSLLILVFALSGCSSKDDAGDFTLDDLVNTALLSTIFERYSSVRAVETYFDPEQPGVVSAVHERVAVKKDGATSMHFLSENGILTVTEYGVYRQYEDEPYAIMAFLDEGIFEDDYLSYLRYFGYLLEAGEELISNTVSDGIRTMTTRLDTANCGLSGQLGFSEGVSEHVMELDTESGLLNRVSSYIIADNGDRILLVVADIIFGQNDDFQPEYITLVQDMSETRTVHFVRNPNTPEESKLTFTLPRQAGIIPITREDYDFYRDAEFTIPHERIEGEQPAELTLYMRLAGAGDFTIDDLSSANTLDAIFSRYASARAEGVYFDHERPGVAVSEGESLVVKRADGVIAYSRGGDGTLLFITADGVYQMNEDGSYGVHAYIDPDVFVEKNLPLVTERFLYASGEPWEEVVSSTVADGTRTVTTHVTASNWPIDWMWGLTNEVVEHVYVTDTESGLIHQLRAYLVTDGGDNIPLVAFDFVYGQDDDFPDPEFVTLCRDMSETRTLHIVRYPNTPEEERFTFTAPRNAGIVPMTRDEYDFYLDAELTQPHVGFADGPPAEATLYIVKAD